MENHVSNLLLLPDEVFLEIFRHLPHTHVVHSFYGLHKRFDACINGYYRNLPLTDVTYGQFDYLCRAVLPQIGSQMLFLSLNNCRYVLQGKLFYQYFSHRMSQVFPNLQKLSLVCFTAEELNRCLKSLNNLPHLDQLEIRDVLTDETTLFQDALTANESRCTSVHFRTSHLDLTVQSQPQLLNLTISLQTLDKLPVLLRIIPSVQQLHVTIDEVSLLELTLHAVEPLIHLTKFFLRCFNHFWSLEEARSLLKIIPAVEQLSLQLSSYDNSFVNHEQELLNLLPKPIQEFHFSLRYYYDSVDEIDRLMLFTSRFPMICLIDEDLEQAVIHTVPYCFPLLNVSSPMVNQMPAAEAYQTLEKFYDYQGMTLAETLPIVARCRRIHEIDVQCDKSETVVSVQQALPSLPKFSRLKRIWFMHPSRDCLALKAILRVAPKLSELFIAFDNLLPAFDDQDTCELLGKDISHLLILRTAVTAPTPISEQHLPTIVTVFRRLQHLQVDVTNGSSIESIVLAVMNAFKDQSLLISLVVEGQTTCEAMKADARQWLLDHSYLSMHDKFDAQFREVTSRFLLWM